MAALAGVQSVYLGLGSNLGDRAALLREAVGRLAPQISVERASSVYETPPWGYVQQPAFLNAVVQGKTALSPQELLAALKGIERALGRDASGPRYGPRPVDLDILIYDELQLAGPELAVPHPRIAERSFVLVPLAELAPQLRLTPGGPTVAELRDQRPDLAQIRALPGISLL